MGPVNCLADVATSSPPRILIAGFFDGSIDYGTGRISNGPGNDDAFLLSLDF